MADSKIPQGYIVVTVCPITSNGLPLAPTAKPPCFVIGKSLTKFECTTDTAAPERESTRKLVDINTINTVYSWYCIPNLNLSVGMVHDLGQPPTGRTGLLLFKGHCWQRCPISPHLQQVLTSLFGGGRRCVG